MHRQRESLRQPCKWNVIKMSQGCTKVDVREGPAARIGMTKQSPQARSSTTPSVTLTMSCAFLGRAIKPTARGALTNTVPGCTPSQRQPRVDAGGDRQCACPSTGSCGRDEERVSAPSQQLQTAEPMVDQRAASEGLMVRGSINSPRRPPSGRPRCQQSQRQHVPGKVASPTGGPS